MRLKDVVVGEKYEYQKWAGFPKISVTVIDVGVPIPYYSFKGALVEQENGRRFATPARALLRPWAEAKKHLEEREEREKKVRKIISELHDTRIEIEAILSSANIDAYVRLFENRPALMIRVSDPKEAEKLLALMGGEQCNTD